jgi:hypothetical protein
MVRGCKGKRENKEGEIRKGGKDEERTERERE